MTEVSTTVVSLKRKRPLVGSGAVYVSLWVTPRVSTLMVPTPMFRSSVEVAGPLPLAVMKPEALVLATELAGVSP